MSASPPPSWRHPGLLIPAPPPSSAALATGGPSPWEVSSPSQCLPLQLPLCSLRLRWGGVGGDLAPLGLPLTIPITMTQQIFTEHYPPASLWAGQSVKSPGAPDLGRVIIWWKLRDDRKETEPLACSRGGSVGCPSLHSQALRDNGSGFRNCRNLLLNHQWLEIDHGGHIDLEKISTH